MISIACPACNKALQIEDEFAGTRGKCPACLATIEIPSDVAPAGEDDETQALKNMADSDASSSETLISAPAMSVPIEVQASASSASSGLGRLGIYELVKVLGQGGMGKVYQARHTKLHKLVALKVLAGGKLGNQDAVARFEREMMAVGQLDHPHIVRAIDAGEVDGVHFLVMEYVEGKDLSDVVRTIGPLPIADACEMIRQAAVGLQEAHEHGMVHRDIKPSNLMLVKSGRKKQPPMVKVLDLGLALLGDAHGVGGGGLTSTGAVMGTIDFMAPEQGGDSHTVDIRADVYSLGATLFKLLTGKAPYEDPRYNTAVKKLMALSNPGNPDIREKRADLPQGLVNLIERMMAKEPDQRLATPEQVATELQPYCSGANLQVLLKRALGEVITEQDTAFTTTSATHSEPIPSHQPAISNPPQRHISHGKKGPPPWNLRTMLIGGGGMMAAFLGIVIILTDRDGKQTKVTVPAGTDVIVNAKPGEMVEIWTDDDSPEQATLPGTSPPAVTSTPGDTPSDTPGRRSKDEGQRALAQWLVDNQCEFLGQNIDSNQLPGGVLPSGPFTVKQIALPRATDALAKRLADLAAPLRAVEGLSLIDVQPELTADGLDQLCRIDSLTSFTCKSATSLKGGDFALLRKLNRLHSVSVNHSAVVDDTVIESLRECPLLSILVLQGVSVSDQGLERLAEFKNLHNLYLDSQLITDKCWASLARIRKLDWLAVLGPKTTGRGVSALSTTPLGTLHVSNFGDDAFKEVAELRLQTLVVISPQVTDAGLAYLSGRELKLLDVRQSSVTEAGAQKLAAQLPQLRIEWSGGVIEPTPGQSTDAGQRALAQWLVDNQFEFSGSNFNSRNFINGALPSDQFSVLWILIRGATDSQAKQLADLAAPLGTVTELVLQETRPEFTAAGLEQLCRIDSVAQFSFLNVGQLSSQDFAPLQKLSRLEGVNLDRCRFVDDAVLEALSECPGLIFLMLNEVPISNRGLERLADFPKLRELYLNCALVTDDCWAPLARIRALKALAVLGPKTTGKGVSALRAAPLELLSVANIDDEAIKELAGFRLQTLAISSQRFTDSGLEHLVGTELKTLHVKEAPVTEAGVQKLAAQLPQCRIAWSGGVIEPTQNAATDDGQRVLAQWLVDNQCEFLGSDIDSQRLTAGALPAGPFSVTRVVISDLTDSHAKQLADLAAPLGTVADLVLVGTRPEFTSAGLEQLCRIDTLNAFTLIGAPELTFRDLAPLQALSRLQSVNLDRCALLDDTVLETLKECPGLLLLMLNGLPISDRGLERLADYPMLKDVYLNSDLITDECWAPLGRIRALDTLAVLSSQVTGKGMSALRAAPLESLKVAYLNDEAIRTIAGFRLHALTMNSDRFTDAGLEHLAGDELRSLDVRGTSVTAAGAQKLAARLPQCRIVWSGGEIEPTESAASP